MYIARKNFLFICILLLVLAMLTGCTAEQADPTVSSPTVTEPPVSDPSPTVQDTYKYSKRHKNYVQPAVVDGWAEKDALTTTTDEAVFFCFTTDSAVADDFVNSQLTLLRYLKNQGVEIGKMGFYGTDYGYSFSESSDKAAYIALSEVKTWQQILVTLQAIWGDYTDYGYVYAMSNAIAEELDWRADVAVPIGERKIDAFFTENPAAIHMLYPTFSTELSSQKTANNSKALIERIFAQIDWQTALAKPIAEQLDAYYLLVSDYAQMLSVPFTRQTCGYAYYGENVQLRIMTTYAELIVDKDYTDIQQAYADCFANYEAIYETANTLNREISSTVEYFGLEDTAGTVRIKFVDEENPLIETYTTGRNGIYYSSTKIIYLPTIWACMHEYHHHIEYLLTGGSNHDWQSQAFCELGASRFAYSNSLWDQPFTEDADHRFLFSFFTGRDYQPGRNDFFEVMDILCFIGDYYQLYYSTGAESINSISRYLMELYGEDTVFDLYLHPETVEEVTGKTWNELQSEWEQHIRNKYAGMEFIYE